MPKTKGLTSIEVAILVTIVILIAVAAAWYMYTTFAASTQAQPRLIIAWAEYIYDPGSGKGTLMVLVANPGPIDVIIDGIGVIGKPCALQGPIKLPVGQRTYINVECTVPALSGATLQGLIRISTGVHFPFTATVR